MIFVCFCRAGSGEGGQQSRGCSICQEARLLVCRDERQDQCCGGAGLRGTCHEDPGHTQPPDCLQQLPPQCWGTQSACNVLLLLIAACGLTSENAAGRKGVCLLLHCVILCWQSSNVWSLEVFTIGDCSETTLHGLCVKSGEVRLFEVIAVVLTACKQWNASFSVAHEEMFSSLSVFNVVFYASSGAVHVHLLCQRFGDLLLHPLVHLSCVPYWA